MTQRVVCLFGTSSDPPTGLAGHVGIAQQLLDFQSPSIKFDEIRVLPVYRHTFADKRQRLVRFDHRLAMCRVAFETLTKTASTTTTTTTATSGPAQHDDIPVVVSDAEYKSWLRYSQKNPDSTVTAVGTAALMEYLLETEPNTIFYFCLGADAFVSLLDGKWKESKRVLDSLQGRFIVINRIEEASTNDHTSTTAARDVLAERVASVPGAILMPVNPSLGTVSSSQIRDCIHKNDLTSLQNNPSIILPSVLEYIQQHGLYHETKDGDADAESEVSHTQGQAQPITSASAAASGGPFRLLLHTQDGVVPYLAPALLHRTFPPEQVSDTLWMGMAVKDTCIQPHTAQNGKIRGYAFASDVESDAWMKPYKRITVPTFDLLSDQISSPPNKTKQSQSASNSSASDHYATDKQVLLWTPHGRHALTPKTYQQIITSPTHSAIAAISLFDMAPTHSESGRNIHKRQGIAVERTKKWWRYCVEQAKNEHTPMLWAPICLHEDMKDDDLNEYLTQVSSSDPSQPIFLIGWNHLPSIDQRHRVLKTIRTQSPSRSIGVLATQSLSQLIEAVLGGVTIAGTNLPTLWAQQKCALAVDWNKVTSTTTTGTTSEDKPSPSKKARTSSEETALNPPSLSQEPCFPGCFSLQPTSSNVSDHPWFRDTQPLVPGCTCHTCQTYHRAYVYHLVCAKELLAEILLFTHNLHYLHQILQHVKQESNHNSPIAVEHMAKVISSMESLTTS